MTEQNVTNLQKNTINSLITRELNINLLAKSNNGKIYLTTINQPDVDFLQLKFGIVELSSKALIEVSNLNRDDVKIYNFRDISDNTVIVTGDTAIIKLIRPQAIAYKTDKIWLKEVNYLTLNQKQQRALIGEDERKPLACYDENSEIYSHSLSSLALENGARGSGSSIGTANLMLTNNHVMQDQTKLTGEIWFNWFNETCNADTPPQNIVKVRCGELLATGGSAANDYSLFTLNDFDYRNAHIKSLFGGLKISEVNPEVGDAVYIPQYGDGGLRPMYVGEKYGNDYSRVTVVTSTIRYNTDTESGSSGSPVLSRENNQIVALHYGGLTDNYNAGVSPATLNQKLGSFFSPYNHRVQGEGKVKISYLEFSPLENQYEITFTKGSKIELPQGTIVQHYENFSRVTIEGQDQNTGYLRELEYELSIKTVAGEVNLTKPLPLNNKILIIRSDLSSASRMEDGMIKGWLLLKILNDNNDLVENRLINILANQYDPFTPPFDLSSAIIGNIAINEIQNNIFNLPTITVSKTLGFVALFVGEGPQALISSGDGYSVIRAPIQNPQTGESFILNLRGYRVTACSTRTLNSAVACGATAVSVILRLEYKLEDNKAADISSGNYFGILPLQAQIRNDNEYKQNILINISFNKESEGGDPTPPIVGITPNSLTINQGDSGSLAAVVSTNFLKESLIYNWILPKDLTPTSSLNNQLVSFTAKDVVEDTTYLIAVEVTNSNSQSATATANVLVKDILMPDPEDKPPLVVVSTPSISICETATTIVSVTASNDTSRTEFIYNWNLPVGLIAQGSSTSAILSFTASEVSMDTNYILSITVTNSKGKFTKIDIPVLVRNQTTPEPIKCKDPAHINYPVWSKPLTYPGDSKVSYQELVWVSKYHVAANQPTPDTNSAWDLASNVVIEWQAKSYAQNHVVNHNGFQWQNKQWAEPNYEPGVNNAWVKVGSASCSRLVR